MIYLTHSTIQEVTEEYNFEHQGYYGLEIQYPSLLLQESSTASKPSEFTSHGVDSCRLYTRTDVDRKLWISKLHHACCKLPFDEVYQIKSTVGKGKFSQVAQALHRVSIVLW